MKKRVLIMLALACAMALAMSGCAMAENNAYALIAAAEKLGYETSNVSLKAQAKFNYDGTWFKTFSGEYKQDGENSFLRIMLDTPREDGSVYTGGYTVVGNGMTSYSNDTIDGNYYVEHSTSENDKLLFGNTVTSAGIATLKYAAAALAPQLDEMIKYTKTDVSNAYTANMSGAPDLVNGALTYMALKYINENYYFSDPMDTYSQLEYADWDALFAHFYRKVTGAEMPISFINQAMEADYEDAMWALYSSIYDELWAAAQDAQDAHTGGVVYMLADGTHEWYTTVADYLRATGIDYVYYTDYMKAFESYYQSVTGKPFTEELNMCVMNSSNPELWDAYLQMTMDMEEMYKKYAAENPEVVAITVREDGTFEPMTNITTDTGETKTRKILRTLKTIAVGEVDARFAIDENGNYTSGEGSVSFEITDKRGETHTLAIEFDAQAYDYGSTRVGAFNPEDYGFVTYDEYLRVTEQEFAQEQDFDYADYCAMLRTLPKAVEFNGVNYDTMIIIEEPSH